MFRSQGITVDHTFGLGGDSLYQEAGYTQLSRGRLSNNLYVASPENPRWEIGHHADDLAQRDALESLVGALSQNREQTMARDHLPTLDGPVIRGHRRHLPTSTPPWPDGSPSMRRWTSPNSSPPPPTAPSTSRLAGRDPQVAMADLSALAALQRHREEWVSRCHDEITTWSQLEKDVRRYEYRLGQVAAYTQPDHVRSLLGPLPERISQVERWQAAAGAIEAYRTRWNISGTQSLGPEPTDLEQRSHWEKTVEIVGAAGFLVGNETSDPASEKASLSARWEKDMMVSSPRRDDERASESTLTLAPEPLWPDEPELESDFDTGFGM